MSVYFHSNFGLNRERMAKILKVGLKNPKLSDEEIAKPFGYKAPFTARYRAWMYRSGLSNLRLPLVLTDFGEVLLKHDPQLESAVAQWFIHHQLTTDPERSETWHFFIKEFLPDNNKFTKSDLLMGLADKLSPHSEEHFGMMSSMNKVIARKLIECYTEKVALGELGFLTKEGKRYVVQNPRGLGPWKTPDSLAKALK